MSSVSSITSVSSIFRGAEWSDGLRAAEVPGRRASPRTLDVIRAENAAFTGRVIGDVVDHSLEESRKARERAQADRAEREAREAQAAAREEEDRKRREQIEADDARLLVEQRRAESRREEAREESLALLTARAAPGGQGGVLDIAA